MKFSTKIKIVIFILIVIGFIINFSVISHLQKKLDYLTILTCEGDSLVIISPKSIKEPTVLLTPKMLDSFNKYSSPFNDGLNLDELIQKYIRNRWTDHYGAVRGTAEKLRIHEGIDLFVPENTPVYPITGYGIITEVSDNPHYLVKVQYKHKDGRIDTTKIEYGKTVRILYPEGIETVYVHLNEVYVTLGQEVNANTKVGLTGKTGNLMRSNKPSHLHMELRDLNNKSFDPRLKLKFNNQSYEFFLKHLKLGQT